VEDFVLKILIAALLLGLPMYAQAGRTNYFRIRVRNVTDDRPGDVEIGPLDKSDARLLFGSSEFATSHPKK
jgi:hypothetical protein